MKLWRYVVIFTLFIFCACVVKAEDDTSLRPAKIRLAVSSLAEPSTNYPLIALTEKALKKEFGEDNVDVQRYELGKLEKIVREGGADVFISSSGTFRRLADTGARSIGTIVSDKLSDPNKSEGSALLVRSDRKDLAHLKDLKGKSVAANMPKGFSGYLMILHEIFKNGFNPKTFFSRTVFVGHDMEEIIRKVLSGEIDAGIVRTCYWEEYAERHHVDKSLLRVVDAKADSLHACKHTSELFPNWVIATTPAASPEVARRAVKSILSVEPDKRSNGLYWGLSTDFTLLDQLLKDLEIGPYEIKKGELGQTFFKHYGREILVFFAIIAILILHHLRVQHLVNKRTNQLAEAYEQNRLVEQKCQKMQKVGLVGLLAGTIAHEIRQPLGAIQFFAKGLQSNLKKLNSETHSGMTGDINAEILAKPLEVTQQIIESAQAADETVKKIRRLASEGQHLERITVAAELQRIAKETVESVGIQKKVKTNFFAEDGSLLVYADPVCFDLVFSNLLRNACEFIAKEGTPILSIRIERRDRYIVTTIRNNGAPVDLSQIQSAKIFTSKSQGMGFGLPIAVWLAENMGGKIAFEAPENGGLTVTVTLPAEDDDE